MKDDEMAIKWEQEKKKTFFPSIFVKIKEKNLSQKPLACFKFNKQKDEEKIWRKKKEVKKNKSLTKSIYSI